MLAVDTLGREQSSHKGHVILAVAITPRQNYLYIVRNIATGPEVNGGITDGARYPVEYRLHLLPLTHVRSRDLVGKLSDAGRQALLLVGFDVVRFRNRFVALKGRKAEIGHNSQRVDYVLFTRWRNVEMGAPRALDFIAIGLFGIEEPIFGMCDRDRFGRDEPCF